MRIFLSWAQVVAGSNPAAPTILTRQGPPPMLPTAPCRSPGVHSPTGPVEAMEVEEDSALGRGVMIA